MLNLAEYRSRPAGLADFLPWAALVEEGVVLNKDGSFQRTARFRGPDLDSATPAELVGVTARLNNALRRLGSGWAIFVEAQRIAAQTYPHSSFPDPASALVDLERQDAFEEAGAHFESRYFLTFVWLPPAEDASRVEGWLYEGRAQTGVDPWELLRGFVDRTNRVLQLVEGFMPEVAWLDDGDTLTYLHSTISTRAQRIRVPETPMHLDALLADEPLAGGLEPRLGAHHLRTLTVVGFPTATHPGILDELNRLAFPYRWSTRAILLDKTEAVKLLTKIRRQWFAKRKSIAAIVKEVMTNEASTLVDSDAANKAADADLALQELGSDDVGQAYVTATVTVWDEDPGLAAEKLRLVEKVIQGRDFTCMPEGVNALEAWLGSIPGHAYANVRQPPVSTLNLAHMIPLSAVWAGPARDEHFQAPPLLYGKTEGSTPFRLSLHVGDVGHTLIVGPTGAGKSVLLALMAMQFRRYRNNQIFAFDFGGSIRTAAIAMGGDWHDLGGSLSGRLGAFGVAAAAGPHRRSGRARLGGGVGGGHPREGRRHHRSDRQGACLVGADARWRRRRCGERTITGLAVLLQSTALKQALQPYCVGGASGRLLDAEAEQLGSAPVQAFETEGLIGAGAAPAVLTYLFHRIEGRLDGRPTLAHHRRGLAGPRRSGLRPAAPRMAEDAAQEERLRRLRHAVAVGYRRQQHRARHRRELPDAYLPAERARDRAADHRDLSPLRLNDRQIEILARATPKRDYYCQSRRGNRLFELGLGPVALAFCAASSKADHAAIERVVAEHGRDAFTPAWLADHELLWAADLIPDLTNLETSS